MNNDVQNIWEAYSNQLLAESSAQLVNQADHILDNVTSFEQFLEKLIEGNPTLKQFADKVSYVSLYTMNKHGFGGHDAPDQQLSRLLQSISLYFHQVIMWPMVQPLRKEKDNLYQDPRVLAHKKEMSIQRRAAMDKGDRELASAILRRFHNVPDDVREKLAQFHAQIDRAENKAKNTPITNQHLTPVDEVSEETYRSIKTQFDKLQNTHDV